MLRWIVPVVAVLLLGATLVADYSGMFGSTEHAGQAILHLRFRIVEAGGESPIDGVHVACMRRRGESLCTQGGTDQSGSVELNFVVTRVTTKTRLFVKSERLDPGADQVQFVFIHPNYDRLFMPVDGAALASMGNTTHRVEMTRSEGQAP
jgi:hypothetical protein